MATIPVANTVRVDMHFTQAGQQLMNSYHVEQGSAWTSSDMTQLGEVFRNWWVAELQSKTPDNLCLNSIVVTDLTEGSNLQVLATGDFPECGSQSNAALPNNVTLAVKWGTGLRGRSFRGRTYHVGVVSGGLQSDRNHITATYQEEIRAAYDALRTALDSFALDVEFVVVSLYSGVDSNGHPIPRAAGVTTPITGVTVNNTLDSQRRRLPERGL